MAGGFLFPILLPAKTGNSFSSVTVCTAPFQSFMHAVSAAVPMPEKLLAEELFLSQREDLEKIVSSVCRRHHLRGADADDFRSWVSLKLIENEYAVFRKFRGESSMTTYLSVVIAMLFREYRVRCWGRWRPSVAARRRGTLAVGLETLIYRDGHPLSEAAQILRSAGTTSLTDRELHALLAELPVHAPPRPIEVGPEPLNDVTAPLQADELVNDAEARRERQVMDRALLDALQLLAPEDAVILRLRYWMDQGVAEIARTLRVPQKPLYRRIERALRSLRTELEKAGISPDHARARISEGLPWSKDSGDS